MRIVDNSWSRYSLICVVLFSLLGGRIAYAQDTSQVHKIVVKVRDRNLGVISGALVTVYNQLNNSVVTSKTTGNSGDVSFDLHPFNDFIIAISKKGFLTKKIWINSQPPEAKRNFKLHYLNEIPIKLFDRIDDEIYGELLSKPSIKISYSAASNDFDINYGYEKAIKSEYERLGKDAREAKFNQLLNGGPVTAVTKPKSGDATPVNAPAVFDEKAQLDAIRAILSGGGTSSVSYEQLIEDGDNSFKAKNYVMAKKKYAAACKKKPLEKYPKDQLSKVNGIIEKDAKLKKELELQYNAALNKGKETMNNNDFQGAKDAYADAINLKPDQKYPKAQYEKASELLAATLKALDEKYKMAIGTGDKELGLKNYEKAKKAYSEALHLKPNEKYASSKLAEIDKQELAQQATIETNYKSEVNKGDKAFNEKDYKTAKEAYLAANKLKKTEAYPKKRIKELDVLIQEMERVMVDINKLEPGNKEALANAAIAEQLQDFKKMQMERIAELKKIKSAYLKKMANYSTKYNTDNPMTRLLDIVDSKKEVAHE